MSRAQERLEALWPRVRARLPEPPARVVEVGCGRYGGFVPALQASGYEVLGIDPAAPQGDAYRQVEVEHSDLPERLDAVVACTSLHHVRDPAQVLDKIERALAPGATVIVIEWDWERFDEATARWCFDRLDRSCEDGWLSHRRDGWAASGLDWDSYLCNSAGEHGLHRATTLVGELDKRFERIAFDRGPYFFSDLAGVSETDEAAAIRAGEIAATRIDYAGRLR